MIQHKDDSSIQGLNGYSVKDVSLIVKDYLKERINDEELKIDKIVEIYPHGSRLRGTARENSDLDVVMFYTGNDREDSLFNTLNDDIGLEMDGIKVDINPIRVSADIKESMQQIERYKEKSMEYDKEILDSRSSSVKDYVPSNYGNNYKRQFNHLKQKNMSNNIKQPVEQANDIRNREKSDAAKRPAVWYASVSFLQDSESVQKIDRLLGKKDKEVLTFVSNWDQGDDIDYAETYKKALRNKGDRIVAQDKYYTLVQNNVAGGTYELLRNVPVADLKFNLERNGYRGVDFPKNGTKDIQNLALHMKAEDLASYKEKEKILVEQLGPSFNYTYPVGHKFVLVDSETSLPHDVYGFYTGNGHLNFKFSDKNDNVPLANIDRLTWEVLEKIVKEHKQEIDLMRNLPDNKESVDLLLKNDTTVWQGYLGNLSKESLKELREQLNNRNDYDEESMKHANADQRKNIESAIAIRKDNMSQVQSELERRLGYNFDMLSELQENCEHYLTDWKGDESRLYNGNVDDEIKQMRTLYEEIPEYMKPQWINKESIDGYEKTMHGVKFLTENKEMNSMKQTKMFAKLQGITEKQASSLLAISSAAVTLLSGLNDVQLKAQPVSVDEEVDKYLKDRVDEGLSRGWFIVHVPEYFPENSNLRKTDFHDAAVFFSPQGIQHRILNRQQFDYAKEQNAIIIDFNRNEYHDIYIGAQSDTESRIKLLEKTSNNLKEDLRKETQIAKSNIIGSLNAIREGGKIFDNITRSKINATHAYECDILASLGDLQSLNNYTYQYIAKELECRDVYFANTNQTVSLGKFHRDMEMEKMIQPSARDYYETSAGTKQAFRIIDAYREGSVRLFEQLQWKLTPEQQEACRNMFAQDKLSDGRKVDDFRVYKEHDQRKPDFGMWRVYIQVGEMKMSRTMSAEDQKAFFNCETTVGELAEKNFGEQLHLASFYNKFKFPEGSDIEQVYLAKNKEGAWSVQVDLGNKGRTSKAYLSWNDKQALFNSRTATKEQLAARYLSKEISEMMKAGYDKAMEFKNSPTLGKDSIDWPKYFVYGQKEDGKAIFLAQFKEDELDQAKAYADSVAKGKLQIKQHNPNSQERENEIKVNNVVIFDGLPTALVKKEYENGLYKGNGFNLNIKRGNTSEESRSQQERSINNSNSITMSKKKTQQVKQDDASVVVKDNSQEKTVNDKVKQTSTEAVSDKPKEKTEEQVQHRPPQMVTVNGQNVSHGHAFQNNKNPEQWFYTAKLDGVQLRPQLMSAEDVKAWQDRTLKVEDAMQHYYPTKLMPKAPKEEFVVYNKLDDGTKVPNLKLSDGRPLDKFSVFKENREGKEDQGKYKMYAEVGNRKLTKVLSHEDLNAFFDRVSTPVKLVEKNFGEQLNLASAYAKYQISDNSGVEKVNLRKNKEGEWLISAQGTFGKTEERPLSKEDKYSLFHTKTATKEQIAAKVFQDGFTAKTEQKIAKSRALHR